MMMTMMVMMRLTMSRLCFELRLFSRLDRALHDDDHDGDDGDDGDDDHDGDDGQRLWR